MQCHGRSLRSAHFLCYAIADLLKTEVISSSVAFFILLLFLQWLHGDINSFLWSCWPSGKCPINFQTVRQSDPSICSSKDLIKIHRNHVRIFRIVSIKHKILYWGFKAGYHFYKLVIQFHMLWTRRMSLVVIFFFFQKKGFEGV